MIVVMMMSECAVMGRVCVHGRTVKKMASTECTPHHTHTESKKMAKNNPPARDGVSFF